MREYIRHPSDIPIEVWQQVMAAEETDYLNDISFGGLSFKAKMPVKEGVLVAIRIPLVDPQFEAKARVRWCRKYKDHYNVGVGFLNSENAYQARMVEQVCHIEHYRREVEASEGRRLTSEEAALEWIARFAERFPSLETTDANTH